MGVASLGADEATLCAESNVLSQGGASEGRGETAPSRGEQVVDRQWEHTTGHVPEPK